MLEVDGQRNVSLSWDSLLCFFFLSMTIRSAASHNVIHSLRFLLAAFYLPLLYLKLALHVFDTFTYVYPNMHDFPLRYQPRRLASYR
jgi:hypothetical protein